KRCLDPCRRRLVNAVKAGGGNAPHAPSAGDEADRPAGCVREVDPPAPLLLKNARVTVILRPNFRVHAGASQRTSRGQPQLLRNVAADPGSGESGAVPLALELNVPRPRASQPCAREMRAQRALSSGPAA